MTLNLQISSVTETRKFVSVQDRLVDFQIHTSQEQGVQFQVLVVSGYQERGTVFALYFVLYAIGSILQQPSEVSVTATRGCLVFLLIIFRSI